MTQSLPALLAGIFVSQKQVFLRLCLQDKKQPDLP